MTNKILSFLFFLVLVSILSFSACGEPPPMDMNPKQKAMVDTLYGRKTKLLRPEMDSLCQLHFDERVALAVDSILKLRLEERETLLNRLK